MDVPSDMAPLWTALAIATIGWLSVGSILVGLVLLSAQRGLVKATMYVVGNLSGYTAIGALALSLGGQLTAQPAIARVVGVALLVLGALLLIGAARSLRTVLGGRDQPLRVLTSLDRMRPRRAFAFGVLVTVVNVKNLVLFMTALGELTRLPAGYRPPALILLVVVFCLGIATPLALRLVLGARASTWLDALRSWLERYGRRVSIVLFVVFASLFIQRGLAMLFG